MKYWLCAASCMMLISGCQVFEKFTNSPVNKDSAPTISLDGEICLLDNSPQALQHNCDIGYWITYWAQVNDLAWIERKHEIAQLGEDIEDRLRKILLSQGPDTPYQDRLRAQNWSEQLFPLFTPRLQQILMTLVYQPSQQVLEFESALAILTRINASQAAEMEAKRAQLLEQQQQLEELLKIEASMMEKREGIKP